MLKFNSFHGTLSQTAQVLITGAISVNHGKGELGKGFYTGEYLHEAKTWAFQCYGQKKNNVIQFEHYDDDFFSLNIMEMNYSQAYKKRADIKKIGKTSTYQFNVDVVWSPIVGTTRVSGYQYKWESQKSNILLNSIKTNKSII